MHGCAKKKLPMTSDKTNERDLTADEDDDPTAELEVLTESDIAAINAQEQLEAEVNGQQVDTDRIKALPSDADALPGDPGESRSSLKAELQLRAEIINALQFQVERLSSSAVELRKETRVLEEARNEIAQELKESTRKNAEIMELLSQRDRQVAALKSALAANDATRDQAEHLEPAEKEAQPMAPPQRDFDPGETRKLIGQGEYASHEFALRPGQMNLGSGVDNDIRIKDQFISRHHVQILSSSRGTILKDMNSTNGTYVNSRRINKCALSDGDSITLGKLSFKFVRQKGSSPDVGPADGMSASNFGVPLDRGPWQ